MARVISTLYGRTEFATTLRASDHVLTARRDGAQCMLCGEPWSSEIAGYMALLGAPETGHPAQRWER
jgi:hypothetical protein